MNEKRVITRQLNKQKKKTLVCLFCLTQVPNTSKERGRFLRRHNELCKVQKLAAYFKQQVEEWSKKPNIMKAK